MPHIVKSLRGLENGEVSPAEERDPDKEIEEKGGVPKKANKDDDVPKVKDGPWAVYRYYGQAAGWGIVAIFVIFNFVEAFASTFASEFILSKIITIIAGPSANGHLSDLVPVVGRSQ